MISIFPYVEVVYLAFLFSPVGGNSLEATIQNQNRLVTYMKATVVITNKIISGLKKTRKQVDLHVFSEETLNHYVSEKNTFFHWNWKENISAF